MDNAHVTAALGIIHFPLSTLHSALTRLSNSGALMVVAVHCRLCVGDL